MQSRVNIWNLRGCLIVMNAQSVVVIDEIDELRKDWLRQMTDMYPDWSLGELTRAADDVVFRYTPHSWSTLLNKRKLNLWQPPQKESLNRSSYSSYDFGNIAVTLIGRSKVEKQKFEAVLKDQGEENPRIVELIQKIEEWPKESVRFNRSKVSIAGKRYLQWKSTLSLIANKRLGWRPSNITPVAAWRLQTRVLFPINKKPLLRGDLVPVIRIDVIDLIENECDEAVSTALNETIANFLINYARDIKYDLLDEDDEFGTPTQFKAEVNFVNQSIERAQAFANWYMANATDDSFDYDDTPVPMFCVATINPGTEEDPPVEAEPKMPAPVTDSMGKPIYLLLEFDLNNVCKKTDGHIYQRWSVEFAEEFEGQHNCSISRFLDEVGYREDDFTLADENHKGFDYFKALAIDANEDFLTIRDALFSARVPKGKWKIPTARLLINLLTRRHIIEVGIQTKPISEFLEPNRTKLLSQGGNNFPVLKVPLTLQNKYHDLAEWATNNNANLIQPTSGFDSGAHYIRLWRDAFDYIFSLEKYHTWRGEAPTWQVFLRYSQCISTFLNCEDWEGDYPEFRSALIHMPESLKARH